MGSQIFGIRRRSMNQNNASLSPGESTKIEQSLSVASSAGVPCVISPETCYE